MGKLLASVLLLNTVDLVLTLYWVLTGMAIECNPIMAAPLERGVLWFATVKIALVSGGVWLLWSRKDRWSSQAAAMLIFIAYALVMREHAFGVRLLWTG